MRTSKLIVSSAIAVGAIFGIGAASAADMPVKARPAPAPVDPAYDWSGFYVGLNGGYGWQDHRPDITVMNQFGTLATTPGLQASGGFGGGQAGYNWQRGWVVFGLEGDIEGASIRDGFNRLVDIAGDNVNASRNISWFGTVRGRFGFAVKNFLFYGTGGFAFGGVQNTLLVSNGGLAANLNSNSTQTGYTAGAGAEYAFNRSWSVKAEYQYINLGSYTLSAPVLPPNGIIVSSTRLTNDFHTVRVGVNYKWGAPAPVVAKY
jgi:outer membrane immunogenic protein